TFQGQVGMPLLLASSRISDFLNQRKILGKMGVHADWEMPVEDEGVLPCHPFTPRYERLAQRSRALRIYPFIKVSLYRENRFFGPGVAQLLELIETYESVRLACQQMGISYSKGWKILTVMEHELDTAIVNRQQGGRNGGTASLTEEGKQLLIKFRELEVRCREFSERAFNEIFHQELEE
ncbi:MAG: LysR family transcriptional regulator, partial [Oscillospiraceae bacterium]